jgi:phosphoglucosamine mutase
MRDKGFNLGGEQSGHVILSDYSTTGDGLVSALKILAIAQKLGKPASEVCRRFEPLPQVLRNVRLHGGMPLENPGVAKAIAEATARLGDRGRLVVRASGTEPVIRVMGEAYDKALVDSLVRDVCDAVARASSDVCDPVAQAA